MLTRSRFPAALGAAALLLAACAKAPETQAPPPTAVDVIAVQPTVLPLELDYSARIAGAREVEVRARVSGILQKRLYTEGSRVREGDVLFRIDPAPFVAALDQARAQLGVAQAQFDEAKRDYDRVVPLAGQGLVSQRDRDQATGAYEGARASVAAAQALVRAAELNYSWTTVRAPISGYTSREARSEGSLVVAGDDSSLLTRIVQSDELYVEFAVVDEEASLLRAALARGGEPIAVEVSTEAWQSAPLKARLAFIDTLVDPGSGTVMARATLRNEEQRLTPGQFVRARVTGVPSPERIVVPKRAVLRSAQGDSVWRVTESDTVEIAPVKLGRAQGNLVTVLEGLAPGERVLVDGVIKVQPGATVAPNAVTLAQASSAATTAAAAAGTTP